MGEAASGRLQAYVLSPLFSSEQHTRSQISQLAMSPEAGRPACHLLLTGFSASLGVLTWLPTSCFYSLSCPSTVPHTAFAFQPLDHVPLYEVFLVFLQKPDSGAKATAVALPVCEINTIGWASILHGLGTFAPTLILGTQKGKTLQLPADSLASVQSCPPALGARGSGAGDGGEGSLVCGKL